MPVFHVVVVNYNSGPHLARCLNALVRQTFADFRATVVDNASHDGSFASARAATSDPRIEFLPLDRNIGFAAANNLAAARADTPWLVTLNPDAFAEPGWLESLAAAAGRYPDADMLSAMLLDDADPARLDGAGDCYAPFGVSWRGGHGQLLPADFQDREVFGPCAAAGAYRRGPFQALGGFDERFFCYVEDVDLAFRMRLSGGRCVQVASARVRHVGGGSGGRGNPLSHYWGTRNRIWTFVKDMPGPLFWPLLPVHIAANLALLVYALPRGRFLPVLRGIGASICGLGAVWRARAGVQAAARAGTNDIARAFTWSPFSILTRGISRM